MIAVADGLGGARRADETAQAALAGFPRRIEGPGEMRAAFYDAFVRVHRLTPDWMFGKFSIAHECPASTLCCAAWTPEAGLVVAYVGDTLAVLVDTTRSGAVEGRTLGLPHRNYYGAITRRLGGMVHPDVLDFDSVLEMVTLTGGDAPRVPCWVVIASDGVWEPLLFTDDLAQDRSQKPPEDLRFSDPVVRDLIRRSRDDYEEPPYGQILAERVAGLCALADADASAVADGILQEARSVGLNDNATVAAARMAHSTGSVPSAGSGPVMSL